MAVASNNILDLVRALPIPTPWNRNVFVENLSKKRGRAITLVPTDTASLGLGPCGLWLSRDDDDLILHEVGTSEYHIDQIVGHEVGHMLLGHDRIDAFGNKKERQRDLCHYVLPDIDPETVRAVLGRTNCPGDEDERDAERFASALMLAVADANERRSIVRSAFFRRR